MSTAKFEPLSITPIQFSLTEGTSIPAPPDSPPDSPRPPTPGKGPLDSHPTTPNKVNGEAPLTPTKDKPFDKAATAPQQQNGLTSPKKMSTVRKFLSLRRPNASRTDLHSQPNGASGLNNKPSSDSIMSSRPGSPLTTLSEGTATSPRSLSRKKSSGWFNSNKRKSGMFMVGRLNDGSVDAEQENQKPLVPRGPPPPTIPEFREFRSLDGALDGSLGGSELFKDIK
jgi:hypothetical protein